MKHIKITNYQEAMDYLKGKKERPYANNTRIEQDVLDMGHEVICVKYHGNIVVTFFKDGNNVYSSAGWKTITTKERINWFLPEYFRVYQESSVWYLSYANNWDWQNSKRYTWEDGITINTRTKEVSNYGKDDSGTKETIKRIKKYVDGYIAELLNGKIKTPSAGDCWYCLMKTQDDKNLGEVTGNQDHIIEHMKEKYYVPSMLNNAYKFNHRLSMMTQDGIARLESGENISDWQKSIVSRDVKSCLTAYLKHCLHVAQ